MIRYGSYDCRGKPPPAGNWPRGHRRRRRTRGGGVRLGLLLRLRARLSGLAGSLLRRVEGLRCRLAGGTTARWSPPRARGPAKAQRRHGRRRSATSERERASDDQSSFYAEAIADCLEFIKSRSSYCPVKDGRDR